MEENPVIIKVESKEGEFIDAEDVAAMREANLKLSEGEPYYVLLDTSNGYANADPDANKLFAAKEFSGKGIAIIAKSLATKIVSNFFIRFNKPYTPTKVFTNELDAINWIKSLVK